MTLNEKQRALCEGHNFDFSGLSAVFLNCTLKPTGTLSHTEALIKVSQAIMEANGVKTELLRPVDYYLPPGVYPDMTEHGFDRDEWPQLRPKAGVRRESSRAPTRDPDSEGHAARHVRAATILT